VNANEIKNQGLAMQLAVVHTMLPKVKELIDQQLEEIEALHRFIDERGETEHLIIWKAQEK
jgi:hypothetical protein